ncbi:MULTISPECIES: enoyl-ACP reductase FabI [Psychrobacillus]|uniref:Enoyl-[acyl-carrier-protein] reductase [NADH] n=1 Tax=Psychrobacillus lasiicapitis TaxID=1636719 RepID=A0A544T503_9BACI|nr:enoyl-ACP reductase FabI [Psychrobacillus lasiicapitis]TQR12496.1 enoyl-ACP reductase FabI [Psychrobacillus lasiicapitis]GGA38598.1 enoyl-[acyl-carrier-protein] reductase [NADH] [Psychrobacillus lasiicapitis]
MKDLIQLKDKNIVVMGVANERSIAWGVAKSLFDVGANVIFTYRKERSLGKIEKALTDNNLEARLVVECDVNSDDSIKAAFEKIGSEVGVIHGVVHSVAFAHAEDLKNDFLQTTRDGYAFAQDTSAYSLIAAAREAAPFMTEGGSIVTMTYLGAERVLEGYNVMGIAKASLEASVRYLALDLGKQNIRVNAVSAGAVRTLAAKGVSSFNTILHKIEETSPLKRNVTAEEVGDMTVGLLGNLSRGVTGEVVYVDSGYNIMG